MNRRLTIAAVAAMLIPACVSGKSVKMTPQTLMDKVKGGWAGQTIGCTFGGPTEFSYKGVTIPDSVAIVWPEHYVKNYFEKTPGLYDDVYMDLTFVNVFEKEGLDAPIESFAKAFAYADYQLWHANLQARVNIVAGMNPPESGHWLNNPHADDIDFQIEADYAGIMAPGMPNAAAFYSDAIGHMMNYGDGWYGGVYVAAMYSLAYVRNDIKDVVCEALDILPKESRYARCIADVIRWHKENPTDWRYAWQKVQDNYTDEEDCPSEYKSSFRIDAVVNGAYIVIGLLYGEGDFDKTLEVSCRCGQDSDCNPASAGGILATMIGYSNIPEKWMSNLREVEQMPFAYTDLPLEKVYRMSYGHACQVIERNGGKVSDKGVKIKVQKPKAVRLEQSFDTVVKTGFVQVDKHAYNMDPEFEFDGCGCVLTGRLRNRKGGDYAADTEIYIDGKLYKKVKILEGNDSQDHVFHAYDLEQGHHKVKIVVTNQRRDKQLWCGHAAIFSKK